MAMIEAVFSLFLHRLEGRDGESAESKHWKGSMKDASTTEQRHQLNFMYSYYYSTNKLDYIAIHRQFWNL